MKMYQYEFNLILIKIFHSLSKVIQIIICFSAVLLITSEIGRRSHDHRLILSILSIDFKHKK